MLTLRRSILTEKVARRGFHVSREYAIDELEILFVRDVMNTDIVVLSTDDTPLAALERIELDRHERSQHLYPILDDAADLVAAATFAELMAWASDPAALDRPLRTLASPSPPTIVTGATLRSAVALMAERGVTRLIAVNPANASHVVGKIALHDPSEGAGPPPRGRAAPRAHPAVRVPAAALAPARAASVSHCEPSARSNRLLWPAVGG